MKFSTRELVLVAVFGTLWGIVEMSFGAVLKSLNVPLSGVVLATIGLTVAMCGRVFVPRRGSTLFIGVIATLLKLFSLGGVIIGPMVAILTEALIAELLLSVINRRSRFTFVVSGAMGVLWCLVQPFITNPLLFGRTLFTVWLDLLDTGSRLLGLDSNAVVVILAGMIVIHLVIGALAGVLAWEVGNQIQVRLGGEYAPSVKRVKN